ncbi:MAG TPA: helix-turn-helix transcriptional regulator [Mesotoga infera]|jgi:transcriptional regulator with XRE-family HTH domain|nr:helix-turn-helix transcriptional regulator [Mesotoga infera]HRR44036.1 helix-turn-helix transcriptional regulator [Mesotoga sp.]HRV01748.1 helix-turn-helix transcriptional regulator [Mesotoga sp.]
MNINKNIGLKIKKIREEMNLSQEQLAVNAGIDRSYMGRVERGEVSVSVLILSKILRALGFDLKSFFSDLE